MQISFIFADVNHVYEHSCVIDHGVAVGDLLDEISEIAAWPAPKPYVCAVYGQRIGLDYVPEAGDRIELLRPLVVSPMEARRLRERKNKRS